MNVKELKEIIQLMNDNDLMEMEIERAGTTIKLKKACSGQGFEQMHRMGAVEYDPRLVSGGDAQHIAKSVSDVKSVEPSNLKEIKSPMVGTFYVAPAPDAAPFAEVGQVVDVGQVVCIVEAMKLMNEIKSEVKGKIVEILGENGQPVEFGQVLFKVKAV